MAIYAIADLHLAFGIDKPMDVFGGRWHGYMDKIEENWKQKVCEDDYIVIPGDISWATYLEEAYNDLRFIDSLPGNKIISKGNHDYWWTTRNKLDKFIEDSGFKTINFMHNNSYKVGNSVICGTRGWKTPGDDDFNAEDLKIYNREILRLGLSLESAASKSRDDIIVALHYPPFNSKARESGFTEVMVKYGVKACIYGHLHGEGIKNKVEGLINGIEYKLISADSLDFNPYIIRNGQ